MLGHFCRFPLLLLAITSETLKTEYKLNHCELISKRPFHHPKQVFVVGLLSLDGEMIDNAKVSARSITHSGDNEVLLSNAPLRVHNPKKDEAKEKHFG